jgi:hypothetical protein
MEGDRANAEANFCLLLTPGKLCLATLEHVKGCTFMLALFLRVAN